MLLITQMTYQGALNFIEHEPVFRTVLLDIAAMAHFACGDAPAPSDSSTSDAADDGMDASDAGAEAIDPDAADAEASTGPAVHCATTVSDRRFVRMGVSPAEASGYARYPLMTSA